MQRRSVLRLAGFAALLAVTFYAGFALGADRMLRYMVDSVMIEADANLHWRIEALARLRTGDGEGAVEYLELGADVATSSLAQERPWGQLDERLQRTISLAKAYRTAYPPAKPSPHLRRVLASTPLPEREDCSAALKQILDLVQERSAEDSASGI